MACTLTQVEPFLSFIDNAFMDRADIKQYIGPPPPKAIYAILVSCLNELIRVGMVEVAEVRGNLTTHAKSDGMLMQTSAVGGLE